MSKPNDWKEVKPYKALVQVWDDANASPAYEWAEAQCTGEWTVEPNAVAPWDFLFMDEQDAMLFKLTWS